MENGVVHDTEVSSTVKSKLFLCFSAVMLRHVLILGSDV
jgi:hypothetical protein